MENINSLEILFLSREDVLNTGIDLKKAIHCIEVALIEHGNHKVENPPKVGIHPREDAFLHAMPAYLPNMKIAGMKWVSNFPSNYLVNIPSVLGIIILNDINTGRPLSIMDCQWITAIRTGAVSAVAVRYLARNDAKTVGIVGAGIQGRYNLLAIYEVLPSIKNVKYFDINKESLEKTISLVKEKVSCEVKPVNSVREAIEESDIIVTATGKLDHVIYYSDWVKEGALILPVHHRGWENRMIHEAEKFITDDWEQLSYAAQMVGGFDGPLPKPYGELGEIVSGKKAGRENDHERIIDFNYGLAIEDIVIANEVYRMAKDKNLGCLIPLMSLEKL